MSASAQAGIRNSDGQEPLQLRSRALKFVREHPYMVGLLVGGAVLGAVVGGAFPMGDLTLARRVVGGSAAGFYFGLFPLGYRLLE